MNDGSLASLLMDRRVWLFILIAVLSAATGLFLVPDSAVLTAVNHLGYWCVLAAFILFVRALWRSYRPDLLAARARGLKAVDWAGVAVIAVGGLILVVHESFGLKIMMDEGMLAGTSMSMHLDRTVIVPTRAGNIQGAFVVLGGLMDKRQIFFPFLVSILHDLTGYRIDNAFYLNAALAFVFLALVNATGRRLGGRRAGWIGVALFAGLPLLAQNATGGGAELLNLVMILATLLLGARYIEKGDGPALEAFCYSAMLLTQVRYESAVFLLPVAVTILMVWRRQGRALLPWPVLVLPLLLIHCALHQRVFEIQGGAWQLQSKPGLKEPFSPRYIPENLAHAVGFFFGRPTDQPNSYVLSALGVLGLAFFLLLVSRKARALALETPVSAATVIFCLGFAAHFALMMSYFWGQFDDAIIRRLSLPEHLWLVLAVMAVLPQFPKAAFQRAVLGIAALGVVAFGLPSMAEHAYNEEYLAGLETQWRRQFVAEHPMRDYLVIDNDSILWIADQVSATTVESARARKEDLEYLMRTHTYSAVYVFQTFFIDPVSGKLTIRDGDDLGSDFVLEPVRTERLVTLTQTRLSRLVEIRKGGRDMSAAPPDQEAPKDRAQIEKARAAYIENFLRRLP